MDEDVKAAVLRLCAKGEQVLDLVHEVIRTERDRLRKLPSKWETIVVQSGLDDAAKEKLREELRQALEARGPPV